MTFANVKFDWNYQNILTHSLPFLLFFLNHKPLLFLCLLVNLVLALSCYCRIWFSFFFSLTNPYSFYISLSISFILGLSSFFHSQNHSLHSCSAKLVMSKLFVKTRRTEEEDKDAQKRRRRWHTVKEKREGERLAGEEEKI